MADDPVNPNPAAPPAGTLAADPSFAKFDPALQGAFKSKGWDVKSPAEAALEAMKSYHEVEKHLGVPRDQILRLPKDANDQEGWKALNLKLGVPEKADGYDFSKIKLSDGSDLDDGFVNMMRETFHANGVPASRAGEIMSNVIKFMEGAETDEAAARQAAIAQGRDALAKSWGANKEANQFIAKQAVVKLGLPEEFVNELEEKVGYAKTMETLLKLGQMMGEDKFVANQNPNAPGVLSREQAEARLAELKRDENWVAKVNKGDHKANEEMNALVRIISTSYGA